MNACVPASVRHPSRLVTCPCRTNSVVLTLVGIHATQQLFGAKFKQGNVPPLSGALPIPGPVKVLPVAWTSRRNPLQSCSTIVWPVWSIAGTPGLSHLVSEGLFGTVLTRHLHIRGQHPATVWCFVLSHTRACQSTLSGLDKSQELIIILFNHCLARVVNCRDTWSLTPHLGGSFGSSGFSAITAF